jgi:hypothetical protein
MTCCIFGLLATAIALFIRRRVLGHKPPADPTAWHLPLPGERD